MTKRLDALMPRTYTDKNGAVKKAYTKIGVAFYNDKLNGYTVDFEALPLPQLYEKKLQCRIILVPPKEDKPATAPATAIPFSDDEIPF